MPLRRTLLLLAAVSLVLITPLARAQTTAPQPAAALAPAFDVVSIRPAKSQRGAGVFFTPDGARANGSPLKYIIRSAYGENRDQFWSGEPGWTDTAYYDIEAEFDPALYKDLTEDQRHAMLQALLADRFKLVIHKETRVLPYYNLVVAKGGPKLRVADASKYMVDSTNQPYCRAGLTNFRQCTMAEFAKVASSLLHIDGIVVDRTGLTGRYDFELIYTRQATTEPAPDAPPDIFTALQEQLGLKLESARGSVPVLVIDHIERPSEN
jgi:uncharacterized protein (TIGR03435 family)